MREIWAVKQRDISELRSWFKARNIDAEKLPAVGFRTKDTAAFMLRCECGMFMVDPVVSRPGHNPRQTHMDLLLLIDRLCFEAKHLGYTKCIGLTDKHGLTRIGQRLGFKLGLTYVLQKDF